MGMHSKALRVAVLLSVVACISSCALNRQDTSPLEKDVAVVEPVLSESDMIGDRSDQQARDAYDISNGEAAKLVSSESQTLLLDSKNGFGVSVERGDAFSKLIIHSQSTNIDYNSLMLENPSRLVVDLLNQPGKSNKDLELNNDPFVKSIRIGGHGVKTRLVFDLKDAKGSEHKINADGGTLTVTFVQLNQLETNVSEISENKLSPKDDSLLLTKDEAIDSNSLQVTSNSNALDGGILIENLNFERTANSSGSIVVSLNNAAAFELKKTSVNEYVLRIPSAKGTDISTYPQIAPKGFPGLRSARVVNKGNDAFVRMFVDNGVELIAKPKGNNILIEAQALSANSEARARLEAAAPPAEAENQTTSSLAEPDENTARENPTGVRAADGSKNYTGRLISLDLQETDIDNALRIIAEVSNLNIIASDDVSGKVTLRLIDVPWDQALDVILKTNGLDQVAEGNVIRIAPVEKLRAEREALREAKKAAENLEDLTVEYIRVSYARVTDLKEQVESILSERGTISVDERTNQIIVKDIKKGHERAIDLLKRLDLRTPQVLLETQIVEGSRNVLRDLGFQWNFTYIKSPETGNATGLNFPNTVAFGGSASPKTLSAGGVSGPLGTAVNFPAVIGLTDGGSAVTAVLDSADGSKSLAAEISALEKEGKVKVVSRPQVATINNKQAEIRSVETVRIRLPDSGTSVATGSGASAAGGGESAFEEIDVGITLKVTPQASPDYYVLLDVNAISSTFGGRTVDNIPSTKEREATSTILVKSGQTFALGGVYRIEDNDTITGVPFLKDLPFLGFLFRRSYINKNDEELIFFITPHIVEGSFDPSLM